MKKNIIEPALYIVPTPIGNLEDITIRAINILKNVDIIACEDTRHSGILLSNLEIKQKKLVSYHNFNELDKTIELVNDIKNGKSVALISDAGTPLISDPGFRIIEKCISQNIQIVSLPGATAFVPALVASGFPVNIFTFVGFPPAKKGRQTFLKSLINLTHTIILYESPHKINKLIEELIVILGGDIEVCLAREISKIYEEYLRLKLCDLKEIIEKKPIKGEIVLVINNQKEK